MQNRTFKDRIKKAVDSFLKELKNKPPEPQDPTKEKENVEEFKKYLEDVKKDAKKRYKIDLVYKQVDQAHLNELIETGIFSFDNVFNACTATGEGCNDRETLVKTGDKYKWVDTANLQKAYRNPKYSESQVALDSIQGDAMQTMSNNNQAANDVSNIMLPKYMGYGMLSPYQSNIWVRKIINLKAKAIYGKGFMLGGDDSEKTRQDIKTIYDAFNKFKVRRVLLTALKRAYLFGGVSIVPKIKGVTDEGLKKKLEFDSKYIPKGSLQGFNVVSPYFCTPMIPNTTDGTGDFYYDPEHWFLINKLIHASRLINLATDTPDEYQSPLYYYRGISIVQALLKYLFQIIISGNSTVNSLLQNSLWLMKTNANYMTDENFQKMVKKIAAERNNSMIVPLKTPDEFYILQIDISHNAETAKFFQETVATLLDAPHTYFLGIAAKGLTTSGMQEMKNWHDIIQTDRVDIGYDDALVSILNEISLSELGYINPSITIENIELDESYEMNRVQASLGFTQIQESLFGMGVIDQQTIANAIAQTPYHVMNKIMQMQIEGKNSIPDETEERDIPDAKLNAMDSIDECTFQDINDQVNYWMIREGMLSDRDPITLINEWNERDSHLP